MVAQDVADRVLEYIKKQGQTNTFKLARELCIKRNKILSIITDLENKGVLEFQSGVAKFLKFPGKEKKVVKKIIKIKTAPKAKRKVKHKAKAKREHSISEKIQAENKRLKERLLELEASKKRQAIIKNKLIREQEGAIKELKKKAKAPNIIRKTIVKKVPVIRVRSRTPKKEKERIKELEKTIKELQNLPPKIIRRTIVKKVPKIIRKIIIKKIPVKAKEKKEEVKPKKFKLPKLKKPEFLGKIRIRKPKINLSKLTKGIKQLHVPEMFKPK